MELFDSGSLVSEEWVPGIMPFTSPKADSREDLVRAGDHSALAALLEENSEPLHRWVERRLDRRLRGRVSASDIVQEVYIDAEHRLEHFGRLGEMPFGVWVRLLARQRLVDLYRRYLVAQARDADREVSMDAGSGPAALAARLAGGLTTPSHAAIRQESAERLHQALDCLEPADKEVLTLRHFEAMNNDAVAARLGLSKSAATKRYVRALARLKTILERARGPLDSNP